MVGSIDPRCETIRGTHWPVEVAGVFGTRVAENHLGQRSTNRTNRPDIWMQAIRSDHQKTLAARGPSTYGSRRFAGTTGRHHHRVAFCHVFCLAASFCRSGALIVGIATRPGPVSGSAAAALSFSMILAITAWPAAPNPAAVSI